MRILVVEDEPSLSKTLVEALTNAAYAVDAALDGLTADELAYLHDYDLILLDLAIPPPGGLELLRAWRANGVDVPVLILTAQDTTQDRVGGLDAGADDYLVKPFSFDELLARVRCLLRRGALPLRPDLHAGDLAMDRATGKVDVAGQSIALTPKEFALLEYLLVNQNRVVSRTELAEHVWDAAFDSATNLINVFVYRLRKKIDGSREQKLIHTVAGRGYLLSPQRR